MAVEVPSAGRATISNTPEGMEITIPSRRSIGNALFLGLWLVGWVFGLVTTSKSLASSQSPDGPTVFLVVWLALWIVFGIYVLWFLAWCVVGREIITLNGRTIRIKKRPWMPRGKREFALNDASNFRVSPDPTALADRGSMRYFGQIGAMSAGTIKFDYGMKTVAFGLGLDEAEAAHLISAMRDRGYIRAERAMSS